MGKGVGSSLEHRKSHPAPEDGKADRTPNGPSCLMLVPVCRHQCPHFADLEVGVAEQGFEAICLCIFYALCQAWNQVPTELCPGLGSLEGYAAF